MTNVEALKKVQWMEATLDTQAAVKALSELRAAGGPRKAGWLAWEDVREDWSDEETAS